jgi:hypothetical protein
MNNEIHENTINKFWNEKRNFEKTEGYEQMISYDKVLKMKESNGLS